MDNHRQHSAHRWGAPIAGQGPDQICTLCGGRRSVMGESSECGGMMAEHIVDTQAAHDYDPHE